MEDHSSAIKAHPLNNAVCCDICGDEGVSEAIVTCTECKVFNEHLYCMRTLQLEMPEIWYCDDCEQRNNKTIPNSCMTEEFAMVLATNTCNKLHQGSSEFKTLAHFVSKKRKIDEENAEKKRIKSKKTKEKDDGNRFLTRTSPNGVRTLLSGLGAEQIQAVKDIGLSCLFIIDYMKLPNVLGEFLLTCLNTQTKSLELEEGSIDIEDIDVNLVMGFPTGELTIEEYTRSEEKGAQYKADMALFEKRHGKKRPSTKGLADYIMQHKEYSNLEFLQDFLICMVSTMLYSYGSNTIRYRLLKSFNSVENIKKLNWCKYITEKLWECTNDWNRLQRVSHFRGPLIFLVLLYADRVGYANVLESRRLIPTIRNWNEDQLNATVFEDKQKGAFGQGKIRDRPIQQDEENEDEENEDEEEDDNEEKMESQDEGEDEIEGEMQIKIHMEGEDARRNNEENKHKTEEEEKLSKINELKKSVVALENATTTFFELKKSVVALENATTTFLEHLQTIREDKVTDGESINLVVAEVNRIFQRVMKQIKQQRQLKTSQTQKTPDTTPELEAAATLIKVLNEDILPKSGHAGKNQDEEKSVKFLF